METARRWDFVKVRVARDLIEELVLLLKKYGAEIKPVNKTSFEIVVPEHDITIPFRHLDGHGTPERN
jgi:hypothetical protein